MVLPLLDDADGDVGAVVGYPLQVRQQIAQDKAQLHGTLSALEPVDMPGPNLVGEPVDGLLQGLHQLGGGGVVGPEAVHRSGEDFLQGPFQHLELRLRRAGEAEALLVELPGGFLDVQGVVPDALKVPDGVEQPGHRVDVLHGEAVLGNLHQVTAEAVLVDIQLVLILQELRLQAPIILGQLPQRGQQAFPGQGPHLAGHGGALADRRAGGAEQQGVQEGELGSLVLFLDSRPRQPFQLAGEGQQQGGGADVENRVAQCHAHGPHGGVHEGEVEQQVPAAEDDKADGRADDIKGNVDDGHPLCSPGDPDGGDQRRDAGADVLAHDDGDGHAVGDGPGEGQGLQNAHGGRRGLDDPGEHRAHGHAQQGIAEGRQQVREARQLRQGADGVLHHLHAGHQNGEANEDASHVPPPLALGPHDEQDARQGEERGEVLRLQEIQKHALALDAGEGQNPRRQRGAHVGAHDDADGLAQLHDAGVHQAHQHHRHRRGGLDGDGDARAQEQALHGVGGHALQKPLQPAAGHLLQALGHGGHAVEEEGQAAAEGKQGKNIHAETPHFRVRAKADAPSYVTASLYM